MRGSGSSALQRAVVGARPSHLIVRRSPALRYQSTKSRESSQTAATASLSPRWLSDVKQRIGKCVTFGLKPHQTDEAGSILQEIAQDWRELVAGSEGYLTGPTRRSMHRQEVVWGEMDSMGHVNNVTYNRYAESGRVQWTRKYANHIDPAHREEWLQLFGNTGIGLILRTITTEFKFPMKWPDRISIFHKLRAEPVQGTDAFVLDVLIMSELHQRPAARCVEDIVIYDYQKGKKAPLKPYMVDVFRETWRLQEEAKRINSQRVVQLLDRVRELEQDTWDRPDAVEDLGSASK